MSTSKFAEELAKKCVEQYADQTVARYIHLRDRSGVAVLSVSPSSVHCPEVAALERVRAAIAGYVQEGIEEGRRQWEGVVREAHAALDAAPSPEALAAAREEGRRAGWAEALARVEAETEARRSAYAMEAEAAERARREWITTSGVRDVIAAAAPGGSDEPR